MFIYARLDQLASLTKTAGAAWLLASALGLSAAHAQSAGSDTGFGASDPEISTESATRSAEDGSVWNRFGLNYTNILFGPSIGDASSFQPNSNGDRDLDNPVYMRNFLSLSYGVTENIAVTGTAYWFYQPVHGQQFLMQDPFMRVSHSSVFGTEWGLNLYSDARVHFGVTDASRNIDLISGLQNFNYLSWNVARTPVTLALRTSLRYNIFGSQGAGADAEVYLAPEAIYQVLPTLALTLLYEMGASHQFGDDLDFFTNDGTDLQPGVSWDVTPNINVNPYLNIHTGGKVTLASTSVGMFFSWNMF